MNTLQVKASKRQPLQAKYKVISFILNTLRNDRGDGGTVCSQGGLEEIVPVFELPLLGGLLAGVEEAQTL
jgi:hypothetical protein